MANTNTVKKLEADVVVVGGGSGGMVAAVKSAESGAKVVLLEKTDSFGGASVMAGGISSVNSKVQVEAGTSERLAEELFSKMMNDTRWIPNPEIVRRFVYTTGVFADWVNTKEPGHIKTFPEHRFVQWHRGAGFCEMISKFCNQENGVDVYMETRATKLLTDKNGDVVGVLATGKDADYEIHAKCVILSSGSFARNKKMLKKYFPERFDNDFEFEFEGGPALSRYADGDGINMAQEIGSMPDRHLDVLVGAGHHGSNITRNITARPDLILVNKNGKRFMAEVMRSFAVHRMLAQPDALAFAIFDSDSLDNIINNPVPLVGESAHLRALMPVDTSQTKERLEEENRAGNTKIANTLDEIAEYIGADPEVFKAEIERFNSFCDKGHDDDYYKDSKHLRPIRKPPFYALMHNIWWQHTRGGIVINENTEVIRKDGTVIKGLYATGDHTSGWFSEFGYVFFTGLNWAYVSAYMAAESSGEYIQSIS